jgi:hypothetical protein
MLVDGVLNVHYNTKRWRIKMKEEIKKPVDELKGEIIKAAEALIGNINNAVTKLKNLDVFPTPMTINIKKLDINNFKYNEKDDGPNILNKKLKMFNGKGVIYVITAGNFNWTKDLEKKYLDLKNNQSMSRIIYSLEEWKKISKNPQCLYVGSSLDVRNRIKQHIGISLSKGKELKTKTTYALYMNTWLADKDVEIKIDIYNFESFETGDKEIPKNYLQILEDLMWECYKPLFGKKGAK